jgi:hypothetical protein
LVRRRVYCSLLVVSRNEVSKRHAMPIARMLQSEKEELRKNHHSVIDWSLVS